MFSRPISSCQRAAVSVLCALLATPVLQARPVEEQITPPNTAGAQISKSPLHPAHADRSIALTPAQRDLHVLNRFTFGPTPASLAEIQKLGIDSWFELQLHPDRLPSTPADQLLATRLAEYPALQLPVDQLLERFPSNAETRQAANGKRTIPSDPTLAAIYRRHIALYQEKQKDKQQDKTDPAKPEAKDMMPGSAIKPDTMPGKSADGAANAASPAPSDGPDPKAILALAPDQRINRIFALPLDQYQDLRASLKGPQKQQFTAGMTPAQRELLADYDNPARTVVQELQSQRLLRDILSSHQLQEVMTTFWLNHFNIYLHKNEEMPYYLTSFERDVIRPRALGNFEDLLVATAESPAMLLYLDNSQSTGPDSAAADKQKQRIAKNNNPNAKKNTPSGLNENYARELMELHTLGVNGGYTQKDVTEVAKVLTGWTVEKPAQGGGFFFDESRHEPGNKKVLGHTIQENGQSEGLAYFHTLANSPKTAHFIAQELAIAFVSDNPAPGLVARMSQTFLHSHGDIPSVLRAMLHSPEFWSPATYQAKIKTPLEYVISTARASDANITNTEPLINQLNQMGMPLYACVPPTGYSDKSDAWVSTGALVTRMNFGLSIATNHYPGITAKWDLPQPRQIDLATAESDLERQLIPAGLTEKTRLAILQQAQGPANPTQPTPISMSNKPTAPNNQANPFDQQNAQLAGLILGSPEFQRR